MSYFKLTINTDAESLSNRYNDERPSLATEQRNRRKSVAELLRCAALMLESGKDTEHLRDHTGGLVGCYDLSHD